MYYILHFIFSYYSLVVLGLLFLVAIYCYFLPPEPPPPPPPPPPPGYIVMLHSVQHNYPHKKVTGGQARLVLWCHLNKYPFPKGYIPRDEDYIIVDSNDTSGKRGIIRNEGADGVDCLVVSSIEDYFYKIDLVNNQVVVEGDKIYVTKECLEAFINNTIVINPWQLRKGKNYKFMLLRACIQAGYDCVHNKYLHRYGACSLTQSQMKEARAIGLDHWYYPTYLKKMEQIKSNNH